MRVVLQYMCFIFSNHVVVLCDVEESRRFKSSFCLLCFFLKKKKILFGEGNKIHEKILPVYKFLLE